MDDTYSNSNDLLEKLEKMVVRTPNGSYIKLDDLKELMRKEREAEVIEAAEQPQRLTVVQARLKAREFLREQAPDRPPQLGKSIPAHSVSRP